MRPRSRTLGALIDELAATRADADAVVFHGERVTFAGLRDRADALARAFLALGVRHGDRVAILLPNRPEWLIAAVAAAKAGAVSVAISTFSTPREIAWALEHAQPRVIVTMEAFRGRAYLAAIHDVCPELGRAELLVVRLGQRAAGHAHARGRARAAGELRAGGGARPPRRRALQRLLRDGEHGPRDPRASGPPAARPGRHAHRSHHRSARGRRDDDRGGPRAAALPPLPGDGGGRALRGGRRPPTPPAASPHARAAAARGGAAG